MGYLSSQRTRRCLTSVGVLVKDKKVLVVYHKNLGEWLFPGGHIKSDETPDQAAEREFFEETGLKVKVVGKKQNFDSEQENESLIIPFHVDLHPINDGKCEQHVAFCYWVKEEGAGGEIVPKEDEVTDYGWIGIEDFKNIKLINNIKKIAHYAIENYPLRK